MLAPEGNLTFWTGNWTTMLHQVFCNDTLPDCAEECATAAGRFDHLCTAVERAAFAAPSMSLFCTPCDYATCNVSLLLNGLESIEGAFLSRIPTGDCNATSLEEEVRLLENRGSKGRPRVFSRIIILGISGCPQ